MGHCKLFVKLAAFLQRCRTVADCRRVAIGAGGKTARGTLDLGHVATHQRMNREDSEQVAAQRLRQAEKLEFAVDAGCGSALS